MKRFIAMMLMACMCFCCAGCGVLAPLTGQWPNAGYADREDQIFAQTVDAFLAALDSRDSDAIAALFSQEARAVDVDLTADIEKLLSIYPAQTSSWYFDGITSGSYSNDHGTRTSDLTARFPIFAGDQVFWCRLTVRYLDQENAQNEGIVCVNFYTGEDYGYHWYEDGFQHSDDPGLTVCWAHSSGIPIRCVQGLPYRFIPGREPIAEAEVLSFLETCTSFDDFVERFGEPCANWDLSYIYGLPDENGEKRYLELVADGEKIYSASVVSEVDWLRSVWKDGI